MTGRRPGRRPLGAAPPAPPVPLPATRDPWVPITCGVYVQEVAALARDQVLAAQTRPGGVVVHCRRGWPWLATSWVDGRCFHRRAGGSLVGWVNESARARAQEDK